MSMSYGGTETVILACGHRSIAMSKSFWRDLGLFPHTVSEMNPCAQGYPAYLVITRGVSFPAMRRLAQWSIVCCTLLRKTVLLSAMLHSDMGHTLQRAPHPDTTGRRLHRPQSMPHTETMGAAAQSISRATHCR